MRPGARGSCPLFATPLHIIIRGNLLITKGWKKPGIKRSPSASDQRPNSSYNSNEQYCHPRLLRFPKMYKYSLTAEALHTNLPNDIWFMISRQLTLEGFRKLVLLKSNQNSFIRLQISKKFTLEQIILTHWKILKQIYYQQCIACWLPKYNAPFWTPLWNMYFNYRRSGIYF